jgi:hypothetical protein
LATKIASLIFLPDRRFFAFTSFQSFTGPSLSFGSSSLISPAKAFPLGLAYAPAAAGKHPQPVAAASDEEHAALSCCDEFRRFCHVQDRLTGFQIQSIQPSSAINDAPR